MPSAVFDEAIITQRFSYWVILANPEAEGDRVLMSNGLHSVQLLKLGFGRELIGGVCFSRNGQACATQVPNHPSKN